ncbi:MAG: hypothetical protein S4CHLAM7_14980 [Chlamydiae bacterium]|nr:hypothetical protein [Chlamydiota bacterium]
MEGLTNCQYNGSVNTWNIYPNTNNDALFKRIFGCCNLIKVDAFRPEAGGLYINCYQNIEGRPNNVVKSSYERRYGHTPLVVTCLENATAWIRQQGWRYGADDGRINGTQKYINCSDAQNMMDSSNGASQGVVSSSTLVGSIALFLLSSMI